MFFLRYCVGRASPAYIADSLNVGDVVEVWLE